MSPLKPCMVPGCLNLQPEPRFRAAVLERVGNQCQALLDDGTRCPVTDPLFAHHTVPLGVPNAYEPESGVCLCRAHHRSVDSHAR